MKEEAEKKERKKEKEVVSTELTKEEKEEIGWGTHVCSGPGGGRQHLVWLNPNGHVEICQVKMSY